jgi:hypothetical protein
LFLFASALFDLSADGGTNMRNQVGNTLPHLEVTVLTLLFANDQTVLTGTDSHS